MPCPVGEKWTRFVWIAHKLRPLSGGVGLACTIAGSSVPEPRQQRQTEDRQVTEARLQSVRKLRQRNYRDTAWGTSRVKCERGTLGLCGQVSSRHPRYTTEDRTKPPREHRTNTLLILLSTSHNWRLGDSIFVWPTHTHIANHVNRLRCYFVI